MPVLCLLSQSQNAFTSIYGARSLSKIYIDRALSFVFVLRGEKLIAPPPPFFTPTLALLITLKPARSLLAAVPAAV